jgi:hypothetical protein
MARFLLSVERINPTDNTSYLVGKESNSTVAVVTRDRLNALECLRCKPSTRRSSPCPHVLAVMEKDPVSVPRPNYQTHTIALAELIEQAARESDGNFYAGAQVDRFVTCVRVTMPDGQAVKLTIEVEA